MTLAINQSHRPHRAIRQCIEAAPGDLFDRKTSLEITRLLERMEGDHRGLRQPLMEAQIFRLGERTVEVIPGITFAMAAGEKGFAVVDRLSVYDRSDRIVKIEIALTRQLPD